jgi:hypothetical protein
MSHFFISKVVVFNFYKRNSYRGASSDSAHIKHLRIENAQPGNEMGYPKDWGLSGSYTELLLTIKSDGPASGDKNYC